MHASMSVSIFLARLLGPLLLLPGIGILVNPRPFRRMATEVVGSVTLVYLFGLIDFAAGLVIILTHNVWLLSWRVLITLIGWLMLIRGTARLRLKQVAEARAGIAPPLVRAKQTKFLRPPVPRHQPQGMPGIGQVLVEPDGRRHCLPAAIISGVATVFYQASRVSQMSVPRRCPGALALTRVALSFEIGEILWLHSPQLYGRCFVVCERPFAIPCVDGRFQLIQRNRFVIMRHHAQRTRGVAEEVHDYLLGIDSGWTVGRGLP